MIEFIQDDDRIREERAKAKQNKQKYVGIDSDNISSSRSFSGGFSDYSKSGFGSGSGYGNADEFGSRKSSRMSDLNDKEWRSSNPSFKDRITDITANIKNMMDQPPDKDHNLDISEDENDPQELGYTKQEDKFKSKKFELDSKVYHIMMSVILIYKISNHI